VLPPTTFRRARRAACAAAIAAFALLGAGCQTIDTYFPTLRTYGVYVLDVNQGNYLSQDMVDKLKVGQTKNQVRQTLGTPLVVSLFRDSRWDYVYEFTRQGVVREHRTLTVYFVDDKLARWEGDEMPISIAELNKSAQAITAGEGAWSDPRSWWEQFLDIFKKK
jgi:outer membrane protein assembly factor BamE